MHGDRMKKNIKVNYKSIFKYDDHHETVQFKSDGIYEKGFDKEKFTFYNNDQKIEIILKGKEIPNPGIPESFRVLQKELQALSIDVNLLDEDGNVMDTKDIMKETASRERYQELSDFRDEMTFAKSNSWTDGGDF